MKAIWGIGGFLVNDTTSRDTPHCYLLWDDGCYRVRHRTQGGLLSRKIHWRCALFRWGTWPPTGIQSVAVGRCVHLA